ncbi:MAG: hypothetical protein V4635_13835 [Bacteroidota bacterium]
MITGNNSGQNTEHSFNFRITSDGVVSQKFKSMGITDFEGAADFIRQLPFRRNENKENLMTLFTDGCGTCGTKHALLKQLADENAATGIKLKLGIFKMNGVNAPAIAATLKQHYLGYIPEAHNYLSFGDQMLDYTWANHQIPDFKDYLLAECEISPEQITAFKVTHHKSFLAQWLKDEQLPVSLEQLWSIREDCIRDLSK